MTCPVDQAVIVHFLEVGSDDLTLIMSAAQAASLPDDLGRCSWISGRALDDRGFLRVVIVRTDDIAWVEVYPPE